MTDSPPLPFVALLILSMPGQEDPATVTVTLAPEDSIQIKGRSKRLVDCTLSELRAFANTLEDEVWQTYDDISLLDLATAKEVAVMAAFLDQKGNVTGELEDWRGSIVLLPAEEAARQTKTTAAKTAPAAEKEPARSGKPAAKPTAPKVKEATTPEADPAKPATAAPPAEQPPPTEEAPAEKPAAPAEPPAPKVEDVEAVAATITFPPPVKPEAVEEARPKPDERPHRPATIEPSEARVRVAGQRLPPGVATQAAVDILMDEPALRAMQAHALSSLDREVAGVMVGPRPEKQPDGRYLVRIIDSIAAKYTVMQGASVTYTADSWRYLNDTLGERYPEETGVMVGWYHTHPGFGIFLSGMDLFIHQNFFTQIWHIAYVLDPRARTSGFFCWNRNRSSVNRYEFGWPDWADGSW